MEIQKVAIIGLGGLGVMFGWQMAQHSPPGSVCFVADEARAARYARQGFVVNGQPASFVYTRPEDGVPVDLLLFAVKASGLAGAIQDAAPFVGPQTTILSLLNGITSEEEIGAVLGEEKMLYCVAQGMDVGKKGGRVEYHHMGMLVLGEKDNRPSERVQAVLRYFAKVGIQAQVPPDMPRHLWSKFMLNVGVNQATAVYNTNYGGIQQPGPARQAMVAAMEEAMSVARKAGVALQRADIEYWLDVLDGLAPQGTPSLKQDMDARRKTEVELFAGTVLRLGGQHGVDTPVNQYFYETITAMEQSWNDSL